MLDKTYRQQHSRVCVYLQGTLLLVLREGCGGSGSGPLPAHSFRSTLQ